MGNRDIQKTMINGDLYVLHRSYPPPSKCPEWWNPFIVRETRGGTPRSILCPPPSRIDRTVKERYSATDFELVAEYVTAKGSSQPQEWTRTNLLRSLKGIIEFDAAIDTIQTLLNSDDDRRTAWSYVWKRWRDTTSIGPSDSHPLHLDPISIYAILLCLFGKDATQQHISVDLSQNQLIRLVQEAYVIFSNPRTGTVVSQCCNSKWWTTPPIASPVTAAPGTAVDPMMKVATPWTTEDAICLAGLLFRVDISRTEEPVWNFYQLCADRSWDVPFCPFGSNTRFHEVYRVTPGQFDVDKVFCPHFLDHYTTDQCKYFAQQLGFSPIDGKDSWVGDERLASALLDHVTTEVPPPSEESIMTFRSAKDALRYVVDTPTAERVWGGRHYDAHNVASEYSRDSIDDQIRDIGISSVVSFGFGSNNTVVYSITDLIDGFTAYRSFHIAVPAPDGTNSNPSVRYLTNRTIGQLKWIASRRYDDDAYLRNLFTRLLDVMKEIERFNQSFATHRQLLWTAALSHQCMDDVITALRLIFDSSMCMRGWKSSEETRKPPHRYPMRSIDTITLPEHQHEIDLRVSEAWIKVTDHLNRMPSEVGKLIFELPLLKFVEVDTLRMIVISVTNGDQGKTLQDLIELVQSGSNADSTIHSCVRLCSNVVLATCFFNSTSMIITKTDARLPSLNGFQLIF